jgi:RimJ/RimL family protein N-acetyltransferase
VRGGYFAERSEAIGLKRGEIVAGVIYENWNHQSIWCHIAVEGRLTPEYLAAIFDYPFNICQVEKIIVPVGSDNEDSTRMVSKMGFFNESCIKNARPEGDIVFWTMQRNDCKYLKDRYGQRLSITTPST